MNYSRQKDLPSVLIVDDDPGISALLTTVLRRAGFTTRNARTGADAIAAARHERPTLVLLDVALPLTSGYEVCRQLRETYGEDLPVIFLSGERVESYDRAAGIMLGADDYVTKPFDPDELLARIRRLVTREGRERRETPRPVYKLTGREQQILTLLAMGGSQTGIASQLSISPKTVATHIQRTLGKLNVHSRAEAVALAHRERLVAPGVSAA